MPLASMLRLIQLLGVQREILCRLQRLVALSLPRNIPLWFQ